MRTRLTLITLIAIALLLPVQAAADGWLKAVHGIDGRDLGAKKNFPVDLAVSGVGCAITNFKFGEITDYIPLPSGSYTIEISLSDGACGNSPVLSPKSRSATVDTSQQSLTWMRTVARPPAPSRTIRVPLVPRTAE